MVSRYNRQELLSFIGRKGQQQLLRSTVAVVGMGALGTVAAEILARAGVGKLVIIDRDVVELTDLQRQLLYDEGDVRRPKALAAAEKLGKINSEIQIVAAAADIDYKSIAAIVGRPDVVLDCTDNLETRFLINEYCLKNKLAWVHAAAVRDSGQLMAFDFRKRPQPCFGCIFGGSAAEGTCDTVGVLSSATTIMAAMQATEAIKLLLARVDKGGVELPLLLRLNVLQNELIKIVVKRNPSCSSCGKNSSYDYLNGKKMSGAVAMCGRNAYQIKGKPVDIEKLKRRLHRIGKVADFGECISFGNLTVFRDGRALVKASSAKEAKSAYSRLVSM